ncbi:DegT/DnrJ/EryC1/StrS family aminotransferase [Kitasatospora cathayae]|uniref:DegT/DnrJ/EryC1/StrS family aminotransferase n=1 Tax=Kitasatospora cathayae TaxID=3004092 RepID=A0ABY7Q3L5_9ACTN|nr:DegT/DnrJ/EryC1/StrS family aminotransferase [Kitasatospora sp. HUAS 3-15]WBP87286.1 DegT/DnrJ/EryC1/StrS family aminotransferase [Kitasatospora sp. HUAS 3-15]
MEALLELADGRPVVEDAAQSQGARRHGRGAYGRIAATGFHPGENLGGHGDAGAVLTDEDELAGAVRLIGDHGARDESRQERFGLNSRMDAPQAVVLRAAGGHCPAPVHLQPAFRPPGYGQGSYPVAERAARELLSPPLHPHLTQAQRPRVVEVLETALGAGDRPGG